MTLNLSIDERYDLLAALNAALELVPTEAKEARARLEALKKRLTLTLR